MKVQAELGARHHRPGSVHRHLVDNYRHYNGPGVLMVTMVIVYNICNDESVKFYETSHLLSGG